MSVRARAVLRLPRRSAREQQQPASRLRVAASQRLERAREEAVRREPARRVSAAPRLLLRLARRRQLLLGLGLELG